MLDSSNEMSTYTQFGYTYAAPTSQLLVGQGSNTTGSNGCCEGTRALMTDPMSGQTVCSCQYDRLAIGSYSRLGSGLGATGGVYGTTYPSSEQNPYPSIGVDSAFYTPLGSGYGMKDGSSGDVSMYGTGLGASPAGYYPYDATFAAYGYGPGYDLAARRKNATRESTATLKAWLNEHKKNPYPTKGEKIMLAIITKMTLTQVSTWFANARRRLKKENKMTWEPRNKTDDDDAKLSDDDDEEKEGADKEEDEIKKDDKDDSSMTETKVEDGEGQTELKSCDGGAAQKTITAALSPAPPLHHNSPFAVSKGEKSDCAVSLQLPKPKIWSLADTAASKTPPPAGAIGGVGGGWLAGGTTFPLPPTIPPSQSQYSRFSQIMSGVNSAQYMAGFSDSVGTDTPPQTPPNASKTAAGNFHNNGNGVYGQSMPQCNQNLSSCSRNNSSQVLPTNNEGAMLQRYSSSVPIPTNQGGSNSNVSMHTTAFSPVYKNSQQNVQQNTSQQNTAATATSSAVAAAAAAAAAMASQHQQQQQQQQQQIQCQQQPQGVTSSYVS